MLKATVFHQGHAQPVEVIETLAAEVLKPGHRLSYAGEHFVVLRARPILGVVLVRPTFGTRVRRWWRRLTWWRR